MNKEREKIVRYYRKCLKEHGYENAQTLDWTSRRSQEVRFEVLLKAASLEGSKILDVGSGLGDFLSFLRKRVKDFQFLGIDIVPEFVEYSQEKYGKKFFNLSTLQDVHEKFDFVFASGSLTYKVKNYKEFYFSEIKKMFSLSKRGVGFNMLNIRYFKPTSECAAYYPEEVLKFCQSLTNKIFFISGYLDRDFTVFLYH